MSTDDERLRSLLSASISLPDTPLAVENPFLPNACFKTLWSAVWRSSPMPPVVNLQH
jgi:hypothetical protein